MVRAVAVVVLVSAWNQQNEVAEIYVVIRCSAYRKRLRKNLSPVVDVDGVRYLQARSRTYELVQIAHRPALLPHEGVQEIAAVRTTAHDLTPGVDGSTPTAGLAGQRSEIVNVPVSPDNSIMNVGCGKVG
jgi:hypothetical protein